MTRMYHSKHAGEIPYLDHTNYHLWSSGIRIHLEAIGAFDIVVDNHPTTPIPIHPTVIPPTTGEATATVVHTADEADTVNSNSARGPEERKTEAKAKGVIVGSCSDSVKLYLAGAKTAKDMWKILKDRMDSSTTSKGRSALRKQFWDLRPVAGRPLIEYISGLSALRYQLAGTEQKIDDEAFREQLLSSLPSGYDNLVEILNEQETSLSVEDVIRKIQQSELVRARRTSAVSANTAGVSGEALLAGRGRGAFRGGRGNHRATPYPTRFAGACNHCGEIGHKAVQCPKRMPNSSGSSQSVPMSCFSCGEQGHGTRFCPYQSLTQQQAAKGRETFAKWRARSGPTRAALAATSKDVSDAQPPGASTPDPAVF